MLKKWRLLDLRESNWLETQAIYHALALYQNQKNTSNTLIITWPDNPLVCIGLHQVIEQSIDLAYINTKNLPIVRRGTGGGSVYLDSNQIFYQIICKKEDYNQSLKDFYEYFLKPTVETYTDFSIPAEYSPINDVIAKGRKISGNGAVTYGNSRVLVGNFIFSFPFSEMAKILKVPDEKFRDKIAKSLEERMGSFEFFLNDFPTKDEVIQRYLTNFQEAVEIELVEGFLLEEEKAKLEEIKQLYKKKEWLYYVEKDYSELFQQKIKGDTYFTFTEKKFQGGLMQLFIHFDNNKISEIIISGDFTISPPFILNEIQENLKNIDINESKITQKLEYIFSTNDIDLPGISIDQISDLIVETFNSIKK